jgi:hypothetical protein
MVVLITSSYNSAIFPVTTGQEYQINYVQYRSPTFDRLNSSAEYWNLTNSDWQTVYDVPYVAEHGDLFLVYDGVQFDLDYGLQTAGPSNMSFQVPDCWLSETRNGSQAYIGGYRNQNGWIPGSGTCHNNSLPLPSLFHVRYGFGKRIAASSRIEISMMFMIIVIACNAMKAIAMLLTVLDNRSDYLVTIGDAAASFLDKPDPITKGLCVLSKNDMLIKFGHEKSKTVLDYEAEDLKIRLEGRWQVRQKRYISSLSRNRQFSGTLL